MVPLGKRVLIHDKPTVRTSWAPHGVSEFYLGPALQHYRSYRVWSTTTNTVRVTDTVAWYPHDLAMPGPTVHDLLIHTIDNLQSTLHKFSNTLPALRNAAQPASSLITNIADNLHHIANMHLLSTPIVPTITPTPLPASGSAVEQSVVSTQPSFPPPPSQSLDRRRDATYYNPQTKEKETASGERPYRIRGTIGGDRVHYPGPTTARAAAMPLVKIFIHSVTSDNAQWLTIDIKDFYLNTPLPRPEYLRIQSKFLPPAIVIKYNMTPCIQKYSILFEVNKGMYGLPQAGLLV